MIIDETHGEVIVGADCEVFETAILTGPLTIGDGVYIGPYAVVGAPAQHRGSYPCGVGSPHRAEGVVIRDGACIREFVQVHQGIIRPTIVGEDCLLMAGAHIAHDSQLGAGVTMGSFSILGGFTLIDDAATFGQGVVTHPWTIIGERAMVGLNSSVVKHVQPYAKVAGAPARLLGSNTSKDAALPSDYSEDLLSDSVWERYARLADSQREAEGLWAWLDHS
jgi:UDP-N-acetylglucosamine acyltransferase